MNGNEAVILAFIHSYTINSDEKCYFGNQQSLANEINATKPTVNRCIRVLKNKAYIKQEKREINGNIRTVYYSIVNINDGKETLPTAVKELNRSKSRNFTNGSKETLPNNSYKNTDKNNYKKIDNDIDI